MTVLTQLGTAASHVSPLRSQENAYCYCFRSSSLSNPVPSKPKPQGMRWFASNQPITAHHLETRFTNQNATL
ncbi:hypothetical protein E2C01_067336 [Portunus trituberculatus]|uniref:Uncharacterized protein n=1 Tax=Portunus trituberculatus TaxID=210409 RepID=A0A5B7HKQ5_PORTR|nr:hypothetical protein [Portunus trituberculatus]